MKRDKISPTTGGQMWNAKLQLPPTPTRYFLAVTTLNNNKTKEIKKGEKGKEEFC